MVLQTKLLHSKDGTEIYAEAVGDPTKPHVVFIHGLALSTLVFSKQFTDEKLLNNLYMVAFDMRGHGRSGKPENAEAYTPQTNADDFTAVVDGFNLKKPIVLAWSLGATVLADVCTIHGPAVLSGLIYIGAQPLFPMLQTFATEFIQTVVGRIDTAASAEDPALVLHQSATTFVESCFADPASLDFETRIKCLGCLALLSPAVLRRVGRRAQDGTRLFQEGGKVLPLLILNGAKDLHCKTDVLIKDMKAIFTDFEAVVVPGGGHAVFWDKPDVVREEILRFVTRIQRQV